jgi:hypothetical protein
MRARTDIFEKNFALNMDQPCGIAPRCQRAASPASKPENG